MKRLIVVLLFLVALSSCGGSTNVYITTCSCKDSLSKVVIDSTSEDIEVALINDGDTTQLVH
jgi:hypothetical protein